MKLLAMETTGPMASVALLMTGREIREISSDQKQAHLQNLIPLIQRLLSESGVDLRELTHIAISEGPGSFTGIRIGMATAKTLAQILNLPVLPVPTLEALAENRPDIDGIHCPILDARRDQIYAGAFLRQGNSCQRLFLDAAYEVDDLVEHLKEVRGRYQAPIFFLGDGVPVYGERLARELAVESSWGKIVFASGEDLVQRGRSLAILAEKRWHEGKAVSYDALQPVYLRKAEAERRLEEKRREKRE